ncbi:uncharacterized protein LOC135465454 [Liolophura sinensis]|uniref:uncharacterized protein LOC135465454 n=1 Tax=Liolophura sinensis TaxID=3198878 RepID=UPI0031590FB1
MFQALFLVLLAIISTSARSFDNSIESQDDFRRDNILPRLLSLVQQRFNYERRLRERDFGLGEERDLNEIGEPEKRFKPLPQGRSGGMSLCLWKVCPAAPWLMSKRPREK